MSQGRSISIFSLGQKLLKCLALLSIALGWSFGEQAHFFGVAQAQVLNSTEQLFDIDDDDLDVGGDIFSDYDEDLESTQVLEDERYYRYGRYYSFTIGAGLTTFTGDRGSAYTNQPPSVAMGVNYFLNFHVSLGIGAEFSKHFLIIDIPTQGFNFPGGPGIIEVNMFRSYFSYRHYLDVKDLGTAITYANPYFCMRMEYWYQTNKYIEQQNVRNDSNGALGIAYGIGLEFPIVIKEAYIGVEGLVHMINFKDSNTSIYQPAVAGQAGGVNDLQGLGLSVIVNYVIGW